MLVLRTEQKELLFFIYYYYLFFFKLLMGKQDSKTVTGFPWKHLCSTTDKTAHLPSFSCLNCFLLWTRSASSFSDTIWCYTKQMHNAEMRISLFAQITYSYIRHTQRCINCGLYKSSYKVEVGQGNFLKIY